MTQATQLSGGPATRYKMKHVEFSTAQLGFGGVPDPALVLKTLEEFHEEGWEVCGLSPAYDRARAALWVFYRRA